MNNKRTTGFWVIMIAGIFLLGVLVLGQAMSLINYEFTVSMGLQEPKDVITEMGVAVNKGFGAGDTLIYIPLLVLGLIGLWKRAVWGIFAISGALAITAYWPVVSLSMLLFARGTTGFNFTQFTSYSILLGGFTLYGLWGLCYVYKNHKLLAGR